jgi:hypothetical protein
VDKNRVPWARVCERRVDARRLLANMHRRQHSTLAPISRAYVVSTCPGLLLQHFASELGPEELQMTQCSMGSRAFELRNPGIAELMDAAERFTPNGLRGDHSDMSRCGSCRFHSGQIVKEGSLSRRQTTILGIGPADSRVGDEVYILNIRNSCVICSSKG